MRAVAMGETIPALLPALVLGLAQFQMSLGKNAFLRSGDFRMQASITFQSFFHYPLAATPVRDGDRSRSEDQLPGQGRQNETRLRSGYAQDPFR